MCEWRLGWIKRNYTLDDEVGNCEGIHIPSSCVFGFDCCILGHLLAYREDLDCLWIVHIYHRFFSELAGWRATISVNSVVGAHFLVSRDFSFYSVPSLSRTKKNRIMRFLHYPALPIPYFQFFRLFLPYLQAVYQLFQDDFLR